MPSICSYGEKELPDLIVGGILVVLVLEATRRAVGWAMVLITGFFVIHSLYANYFFRFFLWPSGAVRQVHRRTVYEQRWIVRHSAACVLDLHRAFHHLRCSA